MKKLLIAGLLSVAFLNAQAGRIPGTPSFWDWGNGNATLTCYGSFSTCATTYPPAYQGGPTYLTTTAAPGRVFTIDQLASGVSDPNPNPPQGPITSQIALEPANISPEQLPAE